LTTAQKLELSLGAGYSKMQYNRVNPEGPFLYGRAMANYKFLQYGMGIDMGAMVYEARLRYLKNRKTSSYYIVKPYFNPHMLVNAVVQVEKLRLYGGVNAGFMFERLTNYYDLYEINKSVTIRLIDADTRNRITLGLQAGLSYPVMKQVELNLEAAPRWMDLRPNYYAVPISVGVRWKL
jgi:hypothetical protein